MADINQIQNGLLPLTVCALLPVHTCYYGVIRIIYVGLLHDYVFLLKSRPKNIEMYLNGTRELLFSCTKK